MSEVVWIERDTVLQIHEEQLQEHGGLSGVRDEGALDSALNRPENLAYYDSITDIVTLAVSYAYGIIHNHPFNDGNKRTGYVVMETFMILNGLELTASNDDCVFIIKGFAAHEMSEEFLAEFIRMYSKDID